MLFSKYPFIKHGLTSMRELSTLIGEISFMPKSICLVAHSLLGALILVPISSVGLYRSPFVIGKRMLSRWNLSMKKDFSVSDSKPMAILGDFNFGPLFRARNCWGVWKNYWDFMGNQYLDPIAWRNIVLVPIAIQTHSINQPIAVISLIIYFEEYCAWAGS